MKMRGIYQWVDNEEGKKNIQAGDRSYGVEKEIKTQHFGNR